MASQARENRSNGPSEAEGSGGVESEAAFGSEDGKGRRVTIDLTAAATQQVDRLRESTGLKTADVFRYALTLFNIYVDEKEKGRQLCIVDPTRQEITIRIELPLATTKFKK